MKAIRLRCPKCRARHSAPAARAGQPFVCKACFGPLIVPEASEAPESKATIAATLPSPGPAPARPRRFAKLGARPMIAFGVVAIVAVVAIVGSHRHRDASASHELALANQDVQDTRVPLAPTIEPPPAPEVKAEAPLIEPAPVVEPQASLPAPTAKPEPPAIRDDPNRPLVIRRRQWLNQESLRRQLAELPEFGAEDRTEMALIALHDVVPPPKPGRSPASALTRQDRERLRRASTDPKQTPDDVVEGSKVAQGKPLMQVARDESAPRELLAMIREKQPELASLPWRMGEECHLGRESAEDLQIVSRALRTLLAQVTTQGDSRPDADALKAALLAELTEVAASEEPPTQAQPQQRARRPRPDNKTRFLVPVAIPALQQLLMAERTPIRLVLVDVVDKIPGQEATKSLARLAMFDLAPEVRERALLALRGRPRPDYRTSFLEGLRYPWAPVADHAAEALVALGDREAVPGLAGLLDLPDPTRPKTEIRDGKAVSLATSLVQVNHLQNCVLCHAPSANATLDLVRGRVPDESQPLPPPVEYYNNSSPGLFVRADVTYLRQDFSVTQPIRNPGPWPSYQRYDYLVTERPTSRWSRKMLLGDKNEYPQREAVLFALRELTGQDLGNMSADWKAGTQPKASSE